MNNREQVGAVWISTSKSGNEYLKIKIKIEGQSYSLIAFTNKRKMKDTQPAFLVFFDEHKKQGE